MRVNAYAARCRPSLGVNILVAEGGIGPRPAGTYHQRLEVVFASKAGRDRSVILVVIVDLATRHRAASDESDKSLGRQRAGIPVAVVARLSFLWSVDAEQADALLAELHGIAIRDRESMRGSVPLVSESVWANAGTLLQRGPSFQWLDALTLITYLNTATQNLYFDLQVQALASGVKATYAEQSSLLV